MLGVLRSVFGTRLTVGAELAGFADHVEVLAPQAVRDHLAHLGASLTRSYGTSRARP